MVAAGIVSQTLKQKQVLVAILDIFRKQEKTFFPIFFVFQKK